MSRTRPAPEIEAVRRDGNLLGECPGWHPGEQALYWVDALAPGIHRLSRDGEVSTWAMPELVASFGFRAAGGLVVALASGFALLDLSTGEVTRLASPERDRPNAWLNDGKCDRRGHFWCGSRDRHLAKPIGSLHRLDPDGSSHRMDEGFIVSNGIAFSPDSRTMYVSDSRAETVWAYDLDLDEGAIRNRRVFFSTRGTGGRPDGATVDADGFYWSALVHGGRIARIDPTGRLDRLIEMPVKHVTMCAFGGPDLDVLYVTSSAAMVTEAERPGVPEAGALFAIRRLGVRGLPEPMFGG